MVPSSSMRTARTVLKVGRMEFRAACVVVCVHMLCVVTGCKCVHACVREGGRVYECNVQWTHTHTHTQASG